MYSPILIDLLRRRNVLDGTAMPCAVHNFSVLSQKSPPFSRLVQQLRCLICLYAERFQTVRVGASRATTHMQSNRVLAAEFDRIRRLKGRNNKQAHRQAAFGILLENRPKRNPRSYAFLLLPVKTRGTRSVDFDVVSRRNSRYRFVIVEEIQAIRISPRKCAPPAATDPPVLRAPMIANISPSRICRPSGSNYSCQGELC